MRFPRPTLPHLLLCAFTLTATVAIALGLHSWLLTLLLPLPIAAVFIEVPLPGLLVKGAHGIAGAGSAGIVLGGLLVTLYPVLPEPLVFGVTRIIGHVLVLIAGLLLLARTPPGRGAEAPGVIACFPVKHRHHFAHYLDMWPPPFLRPAHRSYFPLPTPATQRPECDFPLSLRRFAGDHFFRHISYAGHKRRAAPFATPPNAFFNPFSPTASAPPACLRGLP